MKSVASGSEILQDEILESVRESLDVTATINLADMQGGPQWTTDTLFICNLSQTAKLTIGRETQSSNMSNMLTAHTTLLPAVEPPHTPPELLAAAAAVAAAAEPCTPPGKTAPPSSGFVMPPPPPPPPHQQGRLLRPKWATSDKSPAEEARDDEASQNHKKKLFPCGRCGKMGSDASNQSWHGDHSLYGKSLKGWCIGGNTSQVEYEAYMRDPAPAMKHMAGTLKLTEEGKRWEPDFKRYTGDCLQYVPKPVPNFADAQAFPKPMATRLMQYVPMKKHRECRNGKERSFNMHPHHHEDLRTHQLKKDR